MSGNEQGRRDREATGATVRRLIDDALRRAGQPSSHPPRGDELRRIVKANCSKWGSDYVWVVGHFRTELGIIQRELGDGIEEILACEPHAGWDRIAKAICTFADWKSYTGTPLTVTERMLKGCRELAAELNNGGAHQYFYNSAGNDWRQLMQLLEEGRETASRKRFRELLGIFPGGEPAVDWDRRRDQLEALQAKDAAAMWRHFEHHTHVWDADPYPREATVRQVVLARRHDIEPIWFDEADFS